MAKYWFEVRKENGYFGIELPRPGYFSTAAYEETLMKLGGFDVWEVDRENTNEEQHRIYYRSKDGDTAYGILVKEKDGVYTQVLDFDEEDKPKSAPFAVFGFGDPIGCNTPEEAAHTLAMAILEQFRPKIKVANY